MEGFYLILITEVVFSAAVSVGLIYFVRRVRASHHKELAERQRVESALEDLVQVQDKVLNEYRSNSSNF